MKNTNSKLNKVITALLSAVITFSVVTVVPTSVIALTPQPTLWVNGENILAKSDKQVKCGVNGKAQYNAGTLTLTSADINNEYNDTGIYAYGIDKLNVVLVGDNAVTSDYGISSSGEINISGDGTLQVTAHYTGIFSDTNLSIIGSDVTTTSKEGESLSANVDVTISSSDISAKSENETGIFAENNILIDESSISANSKKDHGIYANNKLSVVDSTVTATSTENIGIYSNASIDLSTSNVSAEGAKGKAAIAVKTTQNKNETPPINITINKYVKEINGGKLAATDWFALGKQTSYTSFVARNETKPLKADLSNALSKVSIKTDTQTLPPATNKDSSFAFAKTLKVKKASVGETVIPRVTAGKQTFDKEEVKVVNSNVKISIKAQNCTAKIGKMKEKSGTEVIIKCTKAGTAKVIATIKYNSAVYTKVLNIKVSK